MPTLILFFLFILSFGAFGQQAPGDDEVELLISRKHAKVIRFNTILSETTELRYNTFVFDLDDTGKQVLGLMADAARRGVKVSLIIDDWEKGLAKKPAYLQALMDLGVDVRVFNPVLKNPAMVNYRNHIKSLITDDELVVGGRNTQGHYFKEYIDVEAHITGSQVDVAKKHFDSVFTSERVRIPAGSKNIDEVMRARAEIITWGAGAKEHLAKIQTHRKYQKNPIKVEKIQYVADPPYMADKKANGINKKIIEMIDRAQGNLDLMNPYVLVTPEEKAALERAIKRGVKVRVSTNAAAVTDSKLFSIAWDIKKKELVDMGVEVYESQQYIHAKTIVRDRSEVFIGSFNLDPRSQNLNLENGIFLENKKLAQELDTHQRRVAKMFTNRYEKTIDKTRNVLMKGGGCIREGINRLITKLVYPIL